MGYRGDYSFEVFNDDYVQLPVDVVAARGAHGRPLADQPDRPAVAAPAS